MIKNILKTCLKHKMDNSNMCKEPGLLWQILWLY